MSTKAGTCRHLIPHSPLYNELRTSPPALQRVLHCLLVGPGPPDTDVEANVVCYYIRDRL